MSYRKKHVKSKISGIRVTKPFFLRLWFWVSLIILLFFLSVCYFILFYPVFQLKNIVIIGNEKILSQDLQNVVAEYSHTGLINFWRVKIDSDSIFLIRKKVINAKILEKYPCIESLSININLPQTIILSLTERKPLGIYCQQDNNCFFLDHSGIIFEKIENTPKGFFIVRHLEDVAYLDVGQKALNQEIVNAIYSTQKVLQDNFKIDIKEVFITSSGRLNVKTSENWQIYLDLDDNVNAETQLTKMKLLLDKMLLDSPTGSGRESLRYIDLRPKDRAIICDNNICG